MNVQNRNSLRLQRKPTVRKPNLRPRACDSKPSRSRTLLSASPWQNPANPLDVTGNGTVNAQDALAIINALNANGGSFSLTAGSSATANSLNVSATSLAATSSSTPAPVTAADPSGLYLDVLGSGQVTPQDACRSSTP